MGYPERFCLGAAGLCRKPATRVCTDSTGQQWFACDNEEHAATAVKTEPIADFFRVIEQGGPELERRLDQEQTRVLEFMARGERAQAAVDSELDRFAVARSSAFVGPMAFAEALELRQHFLNRLVRDCSRIDELLTTTTELSASDKAALLLQMCRTMRRGLGALLDFFSGPTERALEHAKQFASCPVCEGKLATAEQHEAAAITSKLLTEATDTRRAELWNAIETWQRTVAVGAMPSRDGSNERAWFRACAFARQRIDEVIAELAPTPPAMTEEQARTAAAVVLEVREPGARCEGEGVAVPEHHCEGCRQRPAVSHRLCWACMEVAAESFVQGILATSPDLIDAPFREVLAVLRTQLAAKMHAQSAGALEQFDFGASDAAQIAQRVISEQTQREIDRKVGAALQIKTRVEQQQATAPHTCDNGCGRLAATYALCEPCFYTVLEGISHSADVAPDIRAALQRMIAAAPSANTPLAGDPAGGVFWPFGKPKGSA